MRRWIRFKSFLTNTALVCTLSMNLVKSLMTCYTVSGSSHSFIFEDGKRML